MFCFSVSSSEARALMRKMPSEEAASFFSRNAMPWKKIAAIRVERLGEEGTKERGNGKKRGRKREGGEERTTNESHEKEEGARRVCACSTICGMSDVSLGRSMSTFSGTPKTRSLRESRTEERRNLSHYRNQ